MAKRVPLNIFILASFNCCPLGWNFSSSKSLKKIGKILEPVFLLFPTMILKNRILKSGITSDCTQLLSK